MASRKIGRKKRSKKKVTKSRHRPAPAQSSPIKVSFATYARNNGDGSVSNLFFKNAAEAEAYAEPDNERHCDDVSEHSLMVNPVTGEIISGLMDPRADESDDDDDDDSSDTEDLDDW